MSLLDDAKTESAKTNKPVCSVAKCDPDLVNEINEALASDDTTDKGVESALRERGVRINAVTLGRHRRGDCTCEPG